ncbi:DUF6287 domain-containing protein [Levilactobacillus angrenensis]|uniref:DUF6287 domain-containing protein n=1 Tax=Levilactobacillus angrenensis TaxID=2486020 RepID=A0ABW1U8N8_9LACO|nr:DUF6287 domain-containing protein [Levilactobacillus angrenensis]
MQKRYLVVIALLVLTVTITGCGTANENNKVVGPYETKIATINRQARAIKTEGSIQKQVAALKKLERASTKYQRGQKKTQQVTLVYQNTIKEIKQLIQTENLQRLKRQSPARFDKETPDSLERKNAALKDLKSALIAQRGVVYTASALKKLIVRVDKQILKNRLRAKVHGEGHRKPVAGESSRKSADLRTMNFHQLKAGDYSSLMGSWKEVGEGFNASDGKGPRWRSRPSGVKLTVSNASLSDGTVLLRPVGNGRATLTEIDAPEETVGKPGKMELQDNQDFTKGDVLTVEESLGVNSWTIDFFPRGSYEKDWPSYINPNKEHIQMGHTHFWEVFEREWAGK